MAIRTRDTRTRACSFLVAGLAATLLYGAGCSSSGSKDDTPPDTGGAPPDGTPGTGKEIVGAKGGNVANSDGGGVDIPAGALPSDVAIDVGPTDTTPPAAAPVGTTADAFIAFLPHGTVFSIPVTLTIPASGNATAVYRLDDASDTTWELVLNQAHFSTRESEFI